jgi:hypothetical protein
VAVDAAIACCRLSPSAAPTEIFPDPERGTIDLDGVVRSNAHDAAHHLWDILRALRAA